MAGYETKMKTSFEMVYLTPTQAETILLDEFATPLALSGTVIYRGKRYDTHTAVPYDVYEKWIREADNPGGFARAWQHGSTFLEHFKSLPQTAAIKNIVKDCTHIVEELEEKLKEHESRNA